MEDLISRQAVKEIRNDGTYIGYSLFPDDDNADYENGFTDAINKVLALPSVQPETIKCCDCMWCGHDNDKTFCDHPKGLVGWVGPTDFCSRAKRRTDD